MELLQRYEGGEEEMTAIGDRYGYWVVHPESTGYDFLAGILAQIKVLVDFMYRHSFLIAKHNCKAFFKGFITFILCIVGPFLVSVGPLYPRFLTFLGPLFLCLIVDPILK